MTKITLTRPDDWHLHVRDGDALNYTVPFSARQFGRAIIMPNLSPPNITTAQALFYRERILAATPPESNFEPLMTLYLTDNTSANEIEVAKKSAHVVAAKLYPAGATTNSDAGVTDIKKCYPALQALQQHNMPLLVHGEVTGSDIDVFDREKAFIDTVLIPVRHAFPELKIVFEHITTRDAVDYVLSEGQHTGATITPQHLLYNRNAIFKGGIRPHYYCLPVLKREEHRLALAAAAISASPKFFLGTDSAPHSQNRKENACGCAGIFSAPLAIELYTRFFDENNALDRLEGFASFFGADFYGLPHNAQTITLQKKDWVVPASYPFPDGHSDGQIVPLHAGKTERWQLI
ncbi:Dihydroorotase [hydrothermal vent metagenome]|uniref:dihydroorotase n=1 Tax=hydrothermal vent metagenome TaxID=652676 RepID=A0A3B0XEB9_9ZZZZ